MGLPGALIDHETLNGEQRCESAAVQVRDIVREAEQASKGVGSWLRRVVGSREESNQQRRGTGTAIAYATVYVPAHATAHAHPFPSVSIMPSPVSIVPACSHTVAHLALPNTLPVPHYPPL
eukprot:668001-Rhodomonas_salina.2